MFGTLMLLVGPTLVFRLLGAFGVRRFATWRTAAADGLAVMLFCTAAAHFAPTAVGPVPGRDELVAMVPPYVPFPALAVHATGVLEILGAVGLLRERTRRAAGAGLAVLFVLMIPANVHAAVDGIPLNGEPATPLWFRIPEQLLFIAVAVWAYAPRRDAVHRPEEVRA
ncbi:DoxX family protein [Streptomyces roseolilacinus]|uniref:DoxX family protein n=1 Tax=Streptomyces roseolilacinus TaxID=66904 RepID=A0A918AXE1_9ACTN|nr:hypothetical protein [Streptomyces roseolilacinus]GGP96799.1 hypothetical protein GCM10010249_13860 [Streptomyces roseolilacinus]